MYWWWVDYWMDLLESDISKVATWELTNPFSPAWSMVERLSLVEGEISIKPTIADFFLDYGQYWEPNSPILTTW